MPSRNNRNATRHHTKSNIYTPPLISDIDSDNPSVSPPDQLSLIGVNPVDSDPEPVVERHGVGGHQLEALIDFHETYGRVRGDDEPRVVRVVTTEVEPLVGRPIPGAHSRPVVHAQRSESLGHTRSPVLTREPTMLESFSRTVRNYVPSSIPIPTAAPSPPRVSRPVSFGSFMTPSYSTNNPQPGSGPPNAPQGIAQHNGENSWDNRGRLSPGYLDIDEVVFASDDENDGLGTIRGLTSYPSVNSGDKIFWAKWDSLSVEGGKSRRLLILGYSSGIQIWDCTNLGSITEVLNLHSADIGRVVQAAILPRSPDAKDSSAHQRPLLGMISNDGPLFVLYSLREQQIVKRIPMAGLECFLSNENFIVLSTATPPALHILSAASFNTLCVIPSSSLVLSPAHLTSSKNSVLPQIDPNNLYSTMTHTAQSQPVCALSRRLLAFASPPPRQDAANMAATQPRTHTHSGSSGFGLSQAELSNTAIKVGSTVLSGMKTLGGIAYSAAKSRVTGSTEESPTKGEAIPGISGLTNLFSRSAPTAGAHERRYSINSFNSGSTVATDLPLSRVSPTAHPSSDFSRIAGYHVSVVDLAPLLTGSTRPTLLSEFLASKRQPIIGLTFTGDGNSLIVSPKDGQVLRIFQIQPLSRVLARSDDAGALTAQDTQVGGSPLGCVSLSSSDSRNSEHSSGEAPWHVYDLRRGRTSAIVEAVSVAQDGRWVAVGTRKRTVHVFPVNPYGGKPDHRSHLEGRVRCFRELQPLSTEVVPLVRLRVSKLPPPDHPRAALAFTFIHSSEFSLPHNLLPVAAPHSGSYSSSSAHSSPVRHGEMALSHPPLRPANFQDILVFDPIEGALSLRRVTVELRAKDRGLTALAPSSNNNIGVTSISLPGMSSTGWLNGSPPTSNQRNMPASALTQMMETPMELIGRDSIIASWPLKRHQDWDEIKHVIRDRSDVESSKENEKKADWLSHAELSTFSPSSRVLPRSMYLSHQFSFQTLGEDYHALIRRYQFDFDGSKLEVRKEVEVSAYSTGTGESFVEGFAATHDVRQISSSFDEPLASAISAGLEYHPSPGVLPMLPNGTPGSKPKSFRNSIPIRTMASGLSDGMSESIGRIRRVTHKVRSPTLTARSDASLPGPVPLEFDEEDFLNANKKHGSDDDGISHGTPKDEVDAESGASLSTPSTHVEPLEEEEDAQWQGWSPEDMQAVDDAERFDHISVVGFMDEEQAEMVQAERSRAVRKGQRG